MMIALQRFNTVHEARLASSALETRGIECEVRDAFTNGVDAELAIALGGVTLLVDENELENGRRILEDGGNDTLLVDDDEATCAGCGGPLANALAVCADCNEQPHREVMTPRRTRLAIVKLKFTLAAIFVALAFAPNVLEPLWRRFTDLSERSVITISWTLAALLIGAVIVKSLNASDSRL